MIWIEMSRDEIHGGGEWGFKKCVWAPSYKNDTRKSSWLFWENILDVKEGDIILHLKGIGDEAAFIGYSIAITNGHQTRETPPQAGNWGYATSFYRALIDDFHAIENPIWLKDFFRNNDKKLIAYLNDLQVTPKNCFFTYQSHRLQCLNGAYFSKCDDQLLKIVLDRDKPQQAFSQSKVFTHDIYAEVRQRSGQAQFAKLVKKNYNFTCCFPECEVHDQKFLIGSHIARWVDNPEKRGDISNGLCLCVFHDKAFEHGYFSLDDNYKVILSKLEETQTSEIYKTYIKPYEKQPIKSADIKPDRIALIEHRFRCKINE